MDILERYDSSEELPLDGRGLPEYPLYGRLLKGVAEAVSEAFLPGGGLVASWDAPVAPSVEGISVSDRCIERPLAGRVWVYVPGDVEGASAGLRLGFDVDGRVYEYDDGGWTLQRATAWASYDTEDA